MKQIQLTNKDIPLIKEKLILKQKGLCLICNRNLKDLPSKDICLDHNHTTGFVRGVLCRSCNICESKIKRVWIRTGAKNKGIDFIILLQGLIKFQSIKDTQWIHPKHNIKNTKKSKKKSKNIQKLKKVSVKKKIAL